eukprot:193146_1
MSEDHKEDKAARKKRKEERRRKREEFQNRLAAVSEHNPKQRNPIIIEIVRDHLKKDIDVFQARWQTNTPLSNQVFLNTPLFWYKKHRWSHKDVKEFFKICKVHRENLDSELSIIWGIDETSKKKKKEKRKKLKEKHLRKESFASLLTLRHSSLRLMQERSMNFVQKNDPKAEKASVKIWDLLVQNRPDDDKHQLNHTQFNISLVDNHIQVDPDMSVDLFYELIRTWEIIEQHREEKKRNPQNYANSKKDKYKQSRHAMNSIKAIGGSAAIGGIHRHIAEQEAHMSELAAVDEAHDSDKMKKKDDAPDPPQKEKIKHIKKRYINRQYVKRILRHINKNIKREHQIANPKKLKKGKLLLVVFGKIFDAIQNGSEFDVQNDYISQALSQEQLNDPIALLEILGTRDAEWRQRVQCLEYIEANIGINENLATLFEEENFLLLIVGWTTQLYDERSRITQTAAELFPSLLTQLLARMDAPALIFDEANDILNVIADGLFTLLKNKRAKTLSDIAHDVLIETINILSTVAQDLDQNGYYRMMNLLYQHTIDKVEKHEKVRAGCIAYSLFIVYGTEAQSAQAQSNNNTLTIDAPNQYPSPCPSDNDEEEVKEDKKKPSTKKEIIKKNVKIAKHPQRAFLFKDVTFMEIFAKAVGNGIEDRSKETRDKTMKVLKKIEMTHNEIIERFIDPMHQKKYEKWKKYNAPKGKKGKRKRKRISPIKRAKTSKPNKLLLNKNTAGSKSHDVTTGSENEQPSIAITNDTANVVPNGTK